jgi:NAD(P)-dependent dehydrogenase (short-subunit alcohol dehydrogenase family)
MRKSRNYRLTVQVATGLASMIAAYVMRPKLRASRAQVVLITGGSRGLGFALAERYGRSGARLILTARDANELGEARKTLLATNAIKSEEDVLIIASDLTDKDQARNLIQHSINHFGRIDVLINNAGIIEVGPFEDQPLDAFRRAMDTNFFSALHTIQALLPHLLRPPRSQASIVNIASIGGKFAMPHMLPYVASKFALVGFSEGLHSELRHKGIRITTVCPGLMRTGGEVHAEFVGQIEKERRWFNLSARTPLVAASVKRAAKQIFDAVADGRAEITITPQAWLAARLVGVAPETTQIIASIINQYFLPDSVTEYSDGGPGRSEVYQFNENNTIA